MQMVGYSKIIYQKTICDAQYKELQHVRTGLAIIALLVCLYTSRLAFLRILDNKILIAAVY
jgi:hypothetical protein